MVANTSKFWRSWRICICRVTPWSSVGCLAPTRPRRISLPTYPFAKERYWIEPDGEGRARRVEAAASRAGGAALHPVLHRNTLDLSMLRFSTRLSGDEAYLRDHGVSGARVLADGSHLEMARAAVEAAAGEDARGGVRLEQMEWLRPVVVGGGGLDLHVELFAEEDGKTGYEIYSGAVGGADEGRVVHSQGWAVIEPLGAAEPGSTGTLLLQRAWQARLVEADVVRAWGSIGWCCAAGMRGRAR